jgi:L-gulonate 5-dehydrogenase
MAIACGADVVINNLHSSEADYLLGIQCQPTLIIDAAFIPPFCHRPLNWHHLPDIGIMGFSDQETVIRQKDITSKELSIFSSRLNSARFPRVIDWMAAGLLSPQMLISHDMEMAQVEQALALFESKPDAAARFYSDFLIDR